MKLPQSKGQQADNVVIPPPQMKRSDGAARHFSRSGQRPPEISHFTALRPAGLNPAAWGTPRPGAAELTAALPRLLVTLCTYNERENIERLVPEILAVVPDAHILVIDDNSPDGTGQYAQTLADADPRVHVLHRAAKEGLGAATAAGMQWGIDRGYELLLNMDADFSHPPRYIPDLLAAMDGADIAIASRYVPGGSVVGWGPKRHIMSRTINFYARMILGLKTKDNSGSFRCYRLSKLIEMQPRTLRARGYAIQEELLYRGKQVGCRFAEVPFQFEERRFGQTKISLKEAINAPLILLKIRITKS
jgi:dolichol-phosphate mannosyltransferase